MCTVGLGLLTRSTTGSHVEIGDSAVETRTDVAPERPTR